MVIIFPKPVTLADVIAATKARNRAAPRFVSIVSDCAMGDHAMIINPGVTVPITRSPRPGCTCDVCQALVAELVRAAKGATP